MKVGIIGAGMMGVSLGYYLSKQGAQVDIYDASPVLGGMVAPLMLEDGTAVDRFYHVILSSDKNVFGLCQELNITDQLRFREIKTGFYYQGAIYPMKNIIEFLKFPPLGWTDRFRLGITVLYAQLVRDWRKLEGISVEKWLIGLSGKRTYQNIWRPLLRAKFDGNFDSTPATYMWSRLVRMKSTRSGTAQTEQAGHIIGGHQVLLKAMVKKIEAMGGKLLLGCPVQEIMIEDEKVVGLQAENENYSYDLVISTLQVPFFTPLIKNISQEYLNFLKNTEYLGIICGLLVLDRPLSGYWTVNITSEAVPFTGIIETTTYIDPQYVGGYHLVYLPKYITPDSSWKTKSEDEIRSIWIQHLKEMIPEFDESWIQHFLVHRERYVEPLHVLNGTHLIPPIQTPLENLFLTTTAQIYPALTNAESIFGYARVTANKIWVTTTDRTELDQKLPG